MHENQHLTPRCIEDGYQTAALHLPRDEAPCVIRRHEISSSNVPARQNSLTRVLTRFVERAGEEVRYDSTHNLIDV
jgi:hypothetical protein